jgi:3-deoxy-7-phosphoheptulonate synthase
MIIVMEQGAREEEIERVIERLVNLGFSVHRSSGVVHTVLGGVGPNEDFDPKEFEVLPGVKECHRVMAPYRLASRVFRPEGTIVQCPGGLEIGGARAVVLAGPSLVESEAQIQAAAEAAAASGAHILRAGAYPPRGLRAREYDVEPQRLRWLREAAAQNSLLVASEVGSPAQVDLVAEFADIFQVGARHMQNEALLQALAGAGRPVVLERAPAATLEELLMAAEVLLAGGNYHVILCERGIRTFEPSTKATLDLSSIPILKKLSHLPVLADPSQSTGRRDKVTPMARAAIAAGADGLMIEIHPDPETALSEGAQSLDPAQFNELMCQCRRVAEAVGRSL